MRVFISWSGDRSRRVALALRDWLPSVVQAAEPWMSDSDIASGANWLSEVGEKLASTDFGVVALTPESLESRWLHFEAGALAKTFTTARLVPYLVGVKKADLRLPLAMFQAEEATEEGTRRLVRSVNAAITGASVAPHRLDAVFNAMWPCLANQLAQIPSSVPGTPASHRTDRDLLEEILAIARHGQRAAADDPTARPSPQPIAVQRATMTAVRNFARHHGLTVSDDGMLIRQGPDGSFEPVFSSEFDNAPEYIKSRMIEPF